MNTINIKRIGLLIKRYFAENKQQQLTFWGIAALVFTIAHNAETFIFYLFISGLIFAGLNFKSFKYTPGGMHFLLIPATHAEKLITNILLNTVYFFAMFLATYVIGTFVGINLGNLLFSKNDPMVFDLFSNNVFSGEPNIDIFTLFYGFAISQSVFMLGSLYFKQNSEVKTMLTIFLIGFAISIVEIIILKFMFGTTSFDSTSINISITSDQNILSGGDIWAKTLGYLSLPFFWVVSYFRLTEKEI